ncbi:ABC transporter substrate-binding protein [Bacillus sp. UNC438CL73TsuS30]|uniref:ABC transporter substrate-binding protein n=1 Tax=Bacillus sp. UNC438CL73TsuS30 TaxID=1340434 RepID=UPI00047C7987|nr:ABC transporter substrate-binding protein [Bacillus sp. UNC438CL73TsuS30]
MERRLGSRLYPVVLCTMIFFILLSGCSLSSIYSNNDHSQTQKVGKQTELVVSAIPNAAIRLSADADAFMAANPNIKIKINEYEENVYKEQAPDLFTSSEKPDIAWYWAERKYKEIVESGALEPLDSMYKSEGWNKELPKSTLNRYTSEDGHKYAVNTNIVWTPVIYYNKKAFRESGIKEPHTFSEFFSMSKPLEKKGYIPLVSAIGDPSNRGHIFDAVLQRNVTKQQFRQLINNDGNHQEMTYQSKEVLNSWSIMRKMAKEMLPKDAATTSEEEARALFVQGKAAMYSSISAQAGILEDELPENFDIGFFYYPQIKRDIKPKVQLYTGDALMVLKGTGKEELAKRFVAFVMSYDRQKALAEQRMFFPSRTDLNNEDLKQYGPLFSKMYKEMSELGTTPLWDDRIPSEVAKVSFKLHLNVMTGKEEPIDAGKELQEIHERYQK